MKYTLPKYPLTLQNYVYHDSSGIWIVKPISSIPLFFSFLTFVQALIN